MDLFHEEQRLSIQQVQGIQSLDKKTTQRRRLRSFYQTMAANSHQRNSRNYAKIQGLRES